jgi:amino acid transporter
MPNTDEKKRLRRAMGFGDLLLFFIITGFAVRWVPLAAAAGPSALLFWVLACLTFYVPLIFCVIELSSRYPDEGGLYVWTKHAFGEFAGFLTGWTYWTSVLPYFAGLLYFTAGNALYIGGDRWSRFAGEPSYFIAFSLTALAVATALNVVGLGIGKWLHNLGAVSSWVPALVLIGMGSVAWIQFGSATQMDAASILPSISFKNVLFVSTLAFTLVGAESASLMGEEVRDARRNIPRALLIAGPVIAGTYMVATLSLLLALPSEEVGHLEGIMQAVVQVEKRIGISGIAPVMAGLITIGGVGMCGAWLATTARLPFVAGLDHYLPAAFARLHPRWGTPVFALVTQAVLAALVALLGQAGETVQGAYSVLVRMALIPTYVPFLFLFAAVIRLEREPVGQRVVRVPGGRVGALLLAGLGLGATAISTILAVVPPAEEENKGWAVMKVVGLALCLIVIGSAVYACGRWRVSTTPRGAAKTE